MLHEYELKEMTKRFNNNYSKSQFDKDHESFYKKTHIQQDIKNSYRLMGLNIDDDEVKIKNKYRELVKKWHPDIFSGDTLENQKISSRNMQILNNAYNIIKKY